MSLLTLQDYLANNTFLADINNEREVKNQTYKGWCGRNSTSQVDLMLCFQQTI